MNAEVIEGELVPERGLEKWTPKFIVSIDEAVTRRKDNVEYMRRVLKENVHYGVIPGAGTKPTLLKPGAEALCADMGLHPDPVDDGPAALDFDGRDHAGEPFIYYQRKVNLYRLHPITGDRVWVGAGSGSCTSWEDKYRWRTSVRTCPQCGKPAIIKGKAEYGGGWVCFRKKDGCGATFPDNAITITGQPLGRVANDRIADLANTILKMADKRALIAAVLNVTGASDVFTQDVDDRDEADDDERARAEATTPAVGQTAPTTGAGRRKRPAPEPEKKTEHINTEPTQTDASGPMSTEQRVAIDTLRMDPKNARPVQAAQARLKEWGFKTWASFMATATALQGAEIEEILRGSETP